jgi:hypothetical protein
MNKHLRYDKQVHRVGFAVGGSEVNYADVPPTPSELKNRIYALANKCRTNYEPIFSDNNQYLPVSPVAQAEPVAPATIAAVPAVPCKSCSNADKQKDMIVKALLVGAGVFVLYKLIAE